MKSIPRVKICGITNYEDALTALSLGADALGFLVGLIYRSEDELSPAAAAKIVSALPPFVSPVLVTHQSDLATVQTLCETVQPHVLQLHGEFPLERIPDLRKAHPHLKIVKAVHVQDEGAVEIARQVAAFVDAIVLDTKTTTRLGGTGLTHDWTISRRVRLALSDTPVMLAGGLTPENVAGAIEQVGPYGVDVNSGVSVYRGKKSRGLIEQFVLAVKRSAMESVPPG